MLDAEREVKHLHFSILAAIKNLLTPEQQAKLSALSKDGAAAFAAETRRRIEGKIARVQAGAHKWAENGRDPSEIARSMDEKFKPLMEAGRVPEAEAELDRALARLEMETAK